MKNFLYLLFSALPLLAQTGPFPPAAGQPGSTAVSNGDESILRWADRVELYVAGETASDPFRDPAAALGPAEGISNDGIVTLGQGGELEVSFSTAFENGEGAEFAIYENAFCDTFLELAFVEVSSDGLHFVRFPSQSLSVPLDVVSGISATNVDGLAGKYVVGFGTPFDLQDLPESPLLDLENVRFVRLVDVVSGIAVDSLERIIFDSFFPGNNLGFECDGVAALATKEFVIPVLSFVPEGGGFRFAWQSRVGGDYCVEGSSSLEPDSWEVMAEVVATTTTSSTLIISEEERFFVRVRRK